MATSLLDTNPIIRLLTQDDPAQSARSRTLFERADRGEVTLLVLEAVIVEVVNVLASKRLYHLPRTQVAALLHHLFALKGVQVPQKTTYERAADLWVNAPQVEDFTDALLVAHMERLKLTTIISFDRDLDRFTGITRQEP